MFKILSILVFLLFIGAPTSMRAQQPQIADQPCDAQFWRQMTFRAWEEAEREIMQNQNLIFKPDSVLQYTCFDQLNKIAAAQGGEIFTHTNYFGEKIIQRGQPESTNNALTAVVYLPLTSYVSQNGFSGDLLGGRAAKMSVASSKSQFSGPTSATSESYSCRQMADIWQSAKCANFIDNNNFDGSQDGEAADGFYPFNTIKAFPSDPQKDVKSYKELADVRIHPSPCNSFPGGAWEQLDLLAENNLETWYQFQTPLGKIYKEVNDKILPVKQGATQGEPYSASCGSAIKTGVTVITKDGPQGEDGVCTNPGCVYSGGSCS